MTPPTEAPPLERVALDALSDWLTQNGYVLVRIEWPRQSPAPIATVRRIVEDEG